MGMKYKLHGPRGDSHLKAFFKLPVVFNSEDIAVLVSPRERDIVDENPDACHAGSKNTSINEDVDSSKTNGSQNVGDDHIMGVGIKKDIQIDGVTGKTMQVVLSEVNKKVVNRRELAGGCHI
jgi:hypothetical protein